MSLFSIEICSFAGKARNCVYTLKKSQGRYKLPHAVAKWIFSPFSSLAPNPKLQTLR